METLLPLSTPSRQPFGVLNDSKLRNLQSIKNRQNAITPNSAPNLKRRAPSPELSDSENIDPNIFDSTTGKRRKAAHTEDVSLLKPSKYGIHIIPAPKPRSTVTATVTPRLDTLYKSSTTPSSAPAAAAGRSPTKGKRMSLTQPRSRFVPPSFNTKSSSLSITAALKGTIAHKKAKKQRTIEESKPKTFFFDIFEETDEQQDYRMNEWTMTQCATGLDISDDEGKQCEKNDRGKENVDPKTLFAAPVTRSVTASRITSSPQISRKDAMLDEARTPLGDLNPTEFYAEGLDATSVVLVHDDSSTTPAQDTPVATTQKEPDSNPSPDFTFQAPTPLPSDDIHSLLATATPTFFEPSTKLIPDTNDLLNGASDNIEIWESESAKDENENLDVKLDEGSAFTLHEL